MVKHIQTIRRQKPPNCLSVFDHFVKLALKGLSLSFRAVGTLELIYAIKCNKSMQFWTLRFYVLLWYNISLSLKFFSRLSYFRYICPLPSLLEVTQINYTRYEVPGACYKVPGVKFKQRYNYSTYPSKVDEMSTTNSWGLSGKK